MKNTIIKGTGNSRSIKSAPTLPESWEAARALLIGDGWPVDVGAPNEAGCQQIGDALNKENLLKDATAALYGLTGEAVPDEVLAAIRPLIIDAKNDGLKWELGSFSRALNNSGSTTIHCSFNPKILMVNGPGITTSVSSIKYGPFQCFSVNPSTESMVVGRFYNSFAGYAATISWGNNSVKLAFETGTGLTDRITLYYAIGGTRT